MWGFASDVVSIVSDCFVVFDSFKMGNTRTNGKNEDESDINSEQREAPDNSQREFGDTLTDIDTNMAKMAAVLQRIYDSQCSMPEPRGDEKHRLRQIAQGQAIFAGEVHVGMTMTVLVFTQAVMKTKRTNGVIFLRMLHCSQGKTLRSTTKQILKFFRT